MSLATSFKLWSDLTPSAKAQLKPALGIGSWDDLEQAEKIKIVRHIIRLGWISDSEKHVQCILSLNDEYKVNVYGKAMFEHGGPHHSYGGYSYDTCCKQAAQKDFFSILKNEDSNVVFELLSLYAKLLIQEYYLKGEATEESLANAYEDFDRFSRAFNGLSNDFGLNILLTREGFMPKQGKVVQEFVVDPALEVLAAKKWKIAREEFADALKEYRLGSPTGYSNSITHLFSALQAFLQVHIRGGTGKGDIGALLSEGRKKGLLPADGLSTKVLDGLVSVVMEYRSKQGDAHPKQEYANEKSARLVLNLVAIFIQSCLV